MVFEDAVFLIYIGMRNANILVIDYGVGNIQSVVNALNFLDYRVAVSYDRDAIARADVYVLPGVGAFGEGMKNLKARGIIAPLAEEVIDKKKPLLGVCLGMQLLAYDSEEKGLHKGLGWIPGHIARMHEQEGLQIPHVGWNSIEAKIKSPLFERKDQGHTFYFDHSYHFVCDSQYISATCDYGGEVVAAVQKDNIFGTQFHPEKSQNNGLKLFRSVFDYIEKL